MKTKTNPAPTQNDTRPQMLFPSKPATPQSSDCLSQAQRAALHALIEARLDGLKGKKRNRRRNEIQRSLGKFVGDEGNMRSIPASCYRPAVTFILNVGREEDSVAAQIKSIRQTVGAIRLDAAITLPWKLSQGQMRDAEEHCLLAIGLLAKAYTEFCATEECLEEMRHA